MIASSSVSLSADCYLHTVPRTRSRAAVSCHIMRPRGVCVCRHRTAHTYTYNHTTIQHYITCSFLFTLYSSSSSSFFRHQTLERLHIRERETMCIFDVIIFIIDNVRLWWQFFFRTFHLQHDVSHTQTCPTEFAQKNKKKSIAFPVTALFILEFLWRLTNQPWPCSDHREMSKNPNTRSLITSPFWYPMYWVNKTSSKKETMWWE